VDYAYSILSVKSFDDEQRIIRGIATTPTPDRGDDVVDPLGVKFQNPIPFHLHHDKKLPVGTVSFDAPTTKGIAFTARIPKVSEPGIVRDRTDEAWHSAKYKLLCGISIGFRPLKAEQRPTGGLNLKSIEVVELSMVSVPMNAETTILSIKSLDTAQRAALSGPPARQTSAVAGPARTQTMTISEQVTAEKAALATQLSRLEDLEQRDTDDGGLGDAEAAERETLTKGIDALSAKIARLSTMERAQALNATTVSVPARNGNGHTARVEVVKKEIPTWKPFVRYAMAVAAGKGSYSDTLQYAKRWEGETPEVVAHIKALAGTITPGSPAWGSELAEPSTFAAGYLELLRARTIIDRVTGWDDAPFNIRFIEQTGGSTVNWVGEAAPKPVGELAFVEHFLTSSKAAGIVVLSDELVRLGTPSAEERVRNDLTKAMAKFLDVQLVTPGVTATANNPASITNGAPTSAASGTTAAALRDDINTALASFSDAELSTATLHIITTEAVARGIALQVNTLGQPEFGTATMQGGSLFGYPVIASNSVPAGLMIFVLAGEVLLADDGNVSLDASNQATLAMDGGATATFNLWQRNCTAIRAERWIRWQKKRDDAVYYLTGAAYAP
jgi:hypothetical protein